jgi:hypothetical protein
MKEPKAARPYRPFPFVLSLSLALASLAASGGVRPGQAVKPPGRTVSVAVIADAALRGNEAWKVDVRRMVGDTSIALQGIAGLTLKIEAYDHWAREDARLGRVSLPDLLPEFLDHLRAAGRPGCDIVLGLIPEGPDGPAVPGLADYVNGVILMKYLKVKGGMRYVLLHEACHLFGAIDLRQKGSVMSLRDPTFGVDEFTRSIIRVNRDRSFRPGDCPLLEGRIDDALGLYRDRRALGLGEDELDVCLALLPRLATDRGSE